MRKLAMFAAAFAALSTGGAYAFELQKTITIKGGVFFPPVMLAAAGDTVRIVNEDDTTHDATANDASWTTGPIEPGQEATLVVASEMTCFESTFNTELKGAFGDIQTGEPPACFELSGDGETTN